MGEKWNLFHFSLCLFFKVLILEEKQGLIPEIEKEEL